MEICYKQHGLLFYLIALIFLGIPLSYLMISYNPIYIIGFSALVALSLVFVINPSLTVLFLIMMLPLIKGIAESTRLFSDSALSVNISGILNVFIPFMVIGHLLVHGIKIQSYKLFKPVVLFIVYLLLTTMYSVSPSFGLREWFRILMPISFYFIIPSLVTDSRQAKKFLFFILFSSIIPLIIGLYQYKNCFGEQFPLNRIASTFGHPNSYSMFLVVCTLIATYLYLSRNWSAGKGLFVGYLGLQFFALFNTFTRIGWLSSLFSLLVLGMMMKKRFVLLLLFALITILLLVPSLSNRFLERIQPDYSALSRFDFNKFSLSLFKEKPFWGAGLGSYPLLSVEQVGSLGENYGKAFGFAPHNDYLKFLAETGLAGLILYLSLMYSALKMGIKFCKGSNPVFRHYGIFLISFILTILLFGTTDAGLSYSWIYLWIVLGVAEIYLRMTVKRDSSQSFTTEKTI